MKKKLFGIAVICMALAWMVWISGHKIAPLTVPEPEVPHIVTTVYAEGTTTTFTGATSDYWHVLSNWTNGLPNSSTTAIIDHDNCIIVGYAEYAQDLIINDNCTLRIYKQVYTDTIEVSVYGTLLIYGQAFAHADTQITLDGSCILDDYGYGGYISTPAIDGDDVLIINGGTLFCNNISVTVLLDPDAAVSECQPYVAE